MPKQDTENQDEDFNEDDEDGKDGEGSSSSAWEGENDDNGSEGQKNQSNFKALYKKVKEQERLLKELTQQKSTTVEKKKPETAEEKYSALEQRVFFAENPEAKEIKDAVMLVVEEFEGKISMERAYKIARADAPKKSESHEDEDFQSKGSKTKSDKKSFLDVLPEEALKLPKEQLSQWKVKHGTNPAVWLQTFKKQY